MRLSQLREHRFGWLKFSGITCPALIAIQNPGALRASLEENDLAPALVLHPHAFFFYFWIESKSGTKLRCRYGPLQSWKPTGKLITESVCLYAQDYAHRLAASRGHGTRLALACPED